MARTAKNDDSATDSGTTAQGRFVVSLPADVGEMIDRVGAKLSSAMEAQTGVGFDLSRAQIVQALVRQALKTADKDETTKQATEAEKVA